MEQGIILTKDNKELDVFFLKSQEPKEPPFEYHKNMTEFDCLPPQCGLGKNYGSAFSKMEDHPSYDHPPIFEAMNELDVNENSAGEGAHKSCCPTGEKGETGEAGINEDDTLYDVIFDSVKRFENTELNIASETAQEILTMVIEKRVKALLDYKGSLD